MSHVGYKEPLGDGLQPGPVDLTEETALFVLNGCPEVLQRQWEARREAHSPETALAIDIVLDAVTANRGGVGVFAAWDLVDSHSDYTAYRSTGTPDEHPDITEGQRAQNLAHAERMGLACAEVIMLLRKAEVLESMPVNLDGPSDFWAWFASLRERRFLRKA